MEDIIIIGAGVIGASIARALAKYDLQILVLEKENDVGDGTSGANSAIVHSGYDPLPNTLKAKVNVLGNKMYDDITRDLDVKFERVGSITMATSEEEVNFLEKLKTRAIANGVEVQILNHEELLKIEPNINEQVMAGLYAPSAGIINPFELVVALMENAMDNGVKLKLDTIVLGISKNNNCFEVKTNKGVFSGKVIINASGLNADTINEMVNPKSFTIIPRKGEYYILDHFDDQYLRHVLFTVPTKLGKGVLVAPTTHKNYLVGPSSDASIDKDDVSTNPEILKKVKEKALGMVKNLAMNQQIRSFAGIRAISDNDDFIIEETSPNFINVAGIQSPGLASAPAIAEMVENMIANKTPKTNYQPKRRPLYRYNELTIAEKQKLVKKNPKFGHIICRCENISEAEVIDAINRNCGATTIKGVKKRVRPGFGKCQGGFCESLVMKILVRELGKNMTDITYGKKGSYILTEETKGEKYDL